MAEVKACSSTIGMKPIVKEKKLKKPKHGASEEAEGYTIHNTETDYLETGGKNHCA